VNYARSNPIHAEPWVMLQSLSDGLLRAEEWNHGCEVVTPNLIPPGPRALLVHDRHMTSTLQAHHGQPVRLEVLAVREEGDWYSRKIVLSAGARRVEFGLVRLRLSLLPQGAQSDIVGRGAPLGEIFSRYEVLTHVEPRWFLRFPRDSAIVQYLAMATPKDAYGRLGTIHCNGQPAVELLEAVPG